jgi:hypothetical protein
LLRPYLLIPSALALIAAACGEFPTSLSASTRGPYRGNDLNAQAPQISLALVGQWRRTVVFVDDFGGNNVIATLWDFRADGTFLQSTVTTNANSGITTSHSAAGRWETDGNIVTLLFDGPGTVQRVTYLFAGLDLILGGTRYIRVI